MNIQEEIKNKFAKGLTIDRVPNKTYDKFKELAKDEFAYDYGLTLKFLMDVYEGVMPLKDEQLLSMFEEVKQEIELLKTEIQTIKQVKEEKQGRVMIDGTRR